MTWKYFDLVWDVWTIQSFTVSSQFNVAGKRWNRRNNSTTRVMKVSVVVRAMSNHHRSNLKTYDGNDENEAYVVCGFHRRETAMGVVKITGMSRTATNTEIKDSVWSHTKVWKLITSLSNLTAMVWSGYHGVGTLSWWATISIISTTILVACDGTFFIGRNSGQCV